MSMAERFTGICSACGNDQRDTNTKTYGGWIQDYSVVCPVCQSGHIRHEYWDVPGARDHEFEPCCKCKAMAPRSFPESSDPSLYVVPEVCEEKEA